MRKKNLYLETSVWNFFYADYAPEKRDITKQFFETVKKGYYEIFISEVVIAEILKAPEEIRAKLFSLITEFAPQELTMTTEAEVLAQKYIAENVMPAKKEEDALHAAVSTVYEMDALISWNFKHLANLRRKDMINSINMREGFSKRLEIITPMEVSDAEG